MNTHRTTLSCAAIAIASFMWLTLPDLFHKPGHVAEASTWPPTLQVDLSVPEEPLVGGEISYSINVHTSSTDPDNQPPSVAAKVYNVTISDTLPAGLTFLSADPGPTRVERNDDGTTSLFWHNLADLNVNDDVQVNVTAALAPHVSVMTALVNTAQVYANRAVDNSQASITSTAVITNYASYIDLKKSAVQSTPNGQALGASGWETTAPGTDNTQPQWPFVYQLTVKNNPLMPTHSAVVTDVLPEWAAYLGGAVPTPTAMLSGPLNSVTLVWDLGDVSTATYTTPRVITIPVGIPYATRSGFAPQAGCIRIPNSTNPTDPGCFNGAVIADDTEFNSSEYDMTGYLTSGELVGDGTNEELGDDAELEIEADYLSLDVTASTGAMSIGALVDYTVRYYIPEYYTITTGIITNTLGDGYRFVQKPGNPVPNSVTYDPATGLSVIVFSVPNANTMPGSSGSIAVAAEVQPTYHNGNPVVAGDFLSHNAIMKGNWTDDVNPTRAGTDSYSEASAIAGNTEEPTLSKQVWDPIQSQYTYGPIDVTSGQMLHFRVVLEVPDDIDVKNAVLQDYLPQGMTVISLTGASATFAQTYSPSPSYFQTATLPVSTTWFGMNALRWDLGFITRTAVLAAEYDALVLDAPEVSDGILVANFGKFSASNTMNRSYSERSLTDINEVEPRLILNKSASPIYNLVGGQTVTFTYAMSNAGSALAYQVAVTDVTPYGIKLAANCGATSSSPKASACSADANAQLGLGGHITWTPIYTATGMPISGTQMFTYTGIISRGIPVGYVMSNLASAGYNGQPQGVTGGRYYPPTGSDGDDNTGVVTLTASLPTLNKVSTPAIVTFGDTIIYTLTVTVPAGLALPSAMITDTINKDGVAYEGTVFTAVSGTPDNPASLVGETVLTAGAGTQIAWSLGNIDNTSSNSPYVFRLVYTATVDGLADDGMTWEMFPPSPLDNSMFPVNDVSHLTWGSTPNAGIDGGSVTNSIAQPLLELSKSAYPDSNLVGNTVSTYTFVLTNVGSSPAYNVVITDALPDEIRTPAERGTLSTNPLITYEADEDATAGEGGIVTFTIAGAVYTTQTVTFAFRTNIVETNGIDEDYINVADADWTSQAADPEGTRVYDDGSEDAGWTADYATATSSSKTLSTIKIATPSTDNTTGLRIGDFVTFTIVSVIPENQAGYWPYRSDVLPDGFHYVPGSLTLTHTDGITASLIPSGSVQSAAFSLVVGGNPNHYNPNVGPHRRLTASQSVEWWYETYINDTDEPQYITISLVTQYVGVNLLGTQIFAPPDKVLEPLVNAQGLAWDLTDYGYFTTTSMHTSGLYSATVLIGQPNLTLTKRAVSPATSSNVGANQTLAYSLVIVNDGAMPAYDVIVSDMLPVSTTLVAAMMTTNYPATSPAFVTTMTAPAPGSRDTISFELDQVLGTANLANGFTGNTSASKVVTITVVVVTDPDIGAKLALNNRARITYYDSQPGAGTDGDDDVSTPSQRDTYPQTALSTITHNTVAPTLSKQGTAKATIGQQVAYTVRIPATPITDTIYNAHITDSVPSALRVDAWSYSGLTGISTTNGNNLVVSVGTIPSNTQITLFITATVLNNSSTVSGTVIANTARMSYASVPGGAPNNLVSSNTVNTTVIMPALAVRKRVELPRNPAGATDTATYTVVLTNVGNSPAYNVVVTDALPAQLAFASTTSFAASSPATATLSGDYPAWSVDSINVGGVVTVTFLANVDPAIGAGLTLANTAGATYSTMPPVNADARPLTATTASATFTTIPPSLAKTGLSPATIGEQVTYTILVPSSPISTSLYNVVLTDSLPSTLSLDGASFSGGVGGAQTVAGNLLNVLWTSIPSDTQASVLVTGTILNNLATISGTAIANTASATYAYSPSDPSNVAVKSAPYTTTVSMPDLAISTLSTLSRSPVGAGDTVTYTLVVTNTGNATAYDVVITDALPSDLAFGATQLITVSDPLVATLGGNYPAWTVQSINPGGVVTITFTASVSDAVGSGLTLVNTAQSYATTMPSGNSQARPVTSTLASDSITSGQPQFAMSKTPSPTPGVTGMPLTFTIQVTNTGIVSATGVVITDSMPLSATFLYGIPAVTADASGTVTWTIGQLNIGETRLVTAVILVDSYYRSWLFANTAYVSSAEGISGNATVTATMIQVADLSISKTAAPQPVIAGLNLTYTLVVSNAGPSGARAVVVTDVLNSNLTYVSCASTGRGVCADNATALTISYPALAMGQVETITLVTLVNSDVLSGTLIANTAIITTPSTESNPANNSASVSSPVVALADVSVTNEVEPDPLVAGDTVTYTMVIHNDGPSTARTVSLADNLDPALTFISCSATGSGVCGGAGNNRTVSYGSLAAGGTQTVTLVAILDSDVVSGTTIANTAMVGALTPESDLTNNTASADEDTIAITEVDISKFDGVTWVTPGASTVYQIIVENEGPSDVSDLSVVDIPPAGIASDTWSCLPSAGASCPAGGIGPISVTVDLEAGSRVVFVMNATLSATGFGYLKNTARITLPDGVGDPTSYENIATDINVFGDTGIAGNIHDSTTGVPIPGAIVTVTDSMGHVYSMTTDTNGDYGFTNSASTPLAAGGAIVVVDAKATGYVPNSGSAFIFSGNVTTLDLGLMPNTLSGVVTDTLTGLPLPDATVIFTSSDGTVFGAVTDASGYYIFTSTVPAPITTGAGSLSASAPGYSPATGYSPNITIHDGANSKNAPLMPTTLTGVVTDRVSGLPIPGATVTVTDNAGHVYATTSDSNGAYVFTSTLTSPLVPGSATIVVVGSADGYATSTSTPVLVAGANTQDLALDPNTVSGVVTDRVTGLPIAGATVILTDSQGNIHTAVTGANGQYTMTSTVNDPIMPGAGRFTVSANGYDPENGYDPDMGYLPNITIDQGANVKDASLTPQGVISGSVYIDANSNGLDDGEQGIPSIAVTLSLESGLMYTATTDGNGNYDFNVIPPGAYTLTVGTPPSGYGPSTNVTITANLPAGSNANNNDFGFELQADLTITMTDDVGMVAPGDIVTYTIVVENNGPMDVTGATVLDALPAEVVSATWTCEDASGSACGASNGTGDLSVTADISTAARVTITIRAVLSPTAVGTLQNIAVVTTPITDPNPANNSTTDTDVIRTTSIGGMIYDTITGDPIYGATVSITDSFGRVYTTTTGADGTYRFTNTPATPLAPGNAVVGVVAPGFVPATHNATVVSGAANTLHAPMAPNTLRGIVTDSYSGLPIPDATVVVTDSAGHTWTVTADANGAYGVTGTASDPLVAGPATVASSHEGYSVAIMTPILKAGDNTQDVALAPNTLTGVVTDSITNLPIAGADVVFTDSDGHVFVTTTGPDGSYIFTGTVAMHLHEGIGNHTVSAAGYATPSGYSLAVTIVTGTSVKDATLTPQGVINGTLYNDVNGDGVIDAPTETGLSGVAVSLTLSTGQVFTTTTDATGVYTFTTVSPGAYTVTAGATPVGFVGTTPGTLSGTLTAGGTVIGLDFGFQLQADLQITKTNGTTNVAPGSNTVYQIVVENNGPAKVMNATLEDIMPAEVTNDTWTCLPASGAICSAGGSGNISATVSLNVGARVTFIVHAALSASASGSLQNTATVTMSAGITDPNPADNNATDIDTFGGTTLTGIARDADSSLPIPGAVVTVTDSLGHVYTTTSAADGSYTFTNGPGTPLVAGPAIVKASATGYGPVSDDPLIVSGAATTQDLTLSPNTLTGVVVDTLTGLPIPGASVVFTDSQGHRFDTTTDADGNYVFTSAPGTPIATGAGVVIASAPGYSPATGYAQGVTIRTGSNTKDAPLTPTTLKGVITDQATGLPIAGATITVTDDAGHVYTTTSDAHGAYAFTSTLASPLVTGSATMTVTADGYAEATTTPVLKAGANTQNQALTPTTLSGVITDTASGLPLPGVTVVFTDSQGHVFSTLTNGSGRYTFTSTASLPIMPGAGTLDASLSGFMPSAGYLPGVTVVAGPNVKDATLTPTTLTGVVTDTLTGLPISGAVVTLTDSLGHVFTTTSGAGGTYTFISTAAQPIAPGNGSLIAGTPGYAPAAGYDPSVSLAVGANTKDAPLTPATLTGTVTDLTTGQPIPGATVVVTDSAGHVYTTTADATGSYAFTSTVAAPLVPGAATINGSANGFGAITATTPLVAGSANNQDLALQPTVLGGVVMDSATHLPIPGATVVVTDSAGMTRTATADANGVYTITSSVANPLGAGPATVGTTAPGYLPGVTNVTVQPGTLNQQDVSLVQNVPQLNATKTAVLLVDADGDGVPSPGDTLRYTVIVSNTGAGEATGVTFDDLPGNYTTLVNGAGTTTAGTVITGNAAGEASVSVALGTLTPGSAATVQFEVRIDKPLPAGVSQVANQATLLSNELPAVLTDDPTTQATGDATVTPVTAAPVIAASKAVSLAVDADSDGVPSPGDTLLYEVAIENRGNTAATGVTFNDTPGANTILVTGSVQTSAGSVISGNQPADAVVAVQIGTLNGGDAVTVTFRARIANPVPLGVTQVGNQGLVDSDQLPSVPTDDPATPAQGDATVTHVTAAPFLAATKTALLSVDADGNGVPSAGDTLLYNVTIANQGNTAASGIAFTDLPDANTTLVTGTVQTSAGSVISGNQTGDMAVNVQIGTLEAGSSASISFKVVVKNPLPMGVTQVTNQGFVSSDQLPVVPTDDPSTPAADDAAVTTITPTPLLVVDKTVCLCNDADHDGLAEPCDGLLYRVSIANMGNAAATGVLFLDTPDANTTLMAGTVKTSAGSIITGNKSTHTSVGVAVGALLPGETVNVQFYVRINENLPASVTQVANQGVVNSNELPPQITNDPSTTAAGDPTVTPVTVKPMLLADKTWHLLNDADGDGVASPGDTLLYVIDIQNSGNAPANNVNLVDTPDANTALVTGTVQTTQGSVVVGNGDGDASINVDLDTLARGERATVTFRAKINATMPPSVTQIANQGAVYSDELPCVLTNDPTTPVAGDRTVTTLPTLLKLTAQKTASLSVDADGNGVVSPGDTLLYRVTLSNTGNLTATNVVFTDTLDRNTTLVVGSVVASGGQVLQGNLSGDKAVRATFYAMPGGSAVSILYAATVNTPAAMVDHITNQGVFRADLLPYLPTDDPATIASGDATQTSLWATPALSATKTADLLNDANGDGLPSPGDTLGYQIVITNNGSMPATGVVFTDTPDANTPLVNGTVQASQGSVITGNVSGDTSVGVDAGTLAARGGQVTITYSAQLTTSFASLVNDVTNQGWVRSNELASFPTDDPATVQAGDATVTHVSAACNTPYDTSEIDNFFTTARLVAPDGAQSRHTLHIMGDKDWVQFYVLGGQVFTVTTSNLSADVDTVLEVYDESGVIMLAENDNYLPGSNASQLVIRAARTSWYFARVTHADPTYDARTSTVCGNSYQISVVSNQPALSATKSAFDLNGAPLMEGDVVLYRIAVTNTLGITQTNVTVTDALPAYTAYETGSAFLSQGALGGPNPLVASFGALAPGQQAVFIFRVKVTDAVAGQTISNTAFIGSDQYPGPAAVGPAEPQPGGGTVVPQPGGGRVVPNLQALSIAKLADDLNGAPLYTGDEIAYTITVANLLTTTQTGIVIRDEVPVGARYISETAFTSRGSISGPSPFIVNVGNLPPGGKAVFHFRVRVNSGAENLTIQNEATATSDQQQTPVRTGPIATQPEGGKVHAGVQALGIRKMAEDVNGQPLFGGDEIRYTVVLVNLLPDWQTHVVMDDALPAHTTYVAGSAQTTLGTLGGPDPLTLNVDVMQPGQAVTLTFRVRVNDDAARQVVENTASATSDQQTSPVSDGPAQPYPAALAGQPESGGGLVQPGQQKLGIQKVAEDINGELLRPGDTIVYTVTVNNLSAEVNTNVILSDGIPSFTTYVAGSATTTLGNVSGPDPLRVDIASLQPGQAATLTFEVTVNADAGGLFVLNQASAASDQQTHPSLTPPVAVMGSADGLVQGRTYYAYLPTVAQFRSDQ